MKALMIACLFLLTTINQTVLAQDESLPSQQRKLPDGSTEIHFSQSDGSKVKQVHRPDGTIEISSLDDNKANATVMLQHPDGSVEFRPKNLS